MFIKVILLVGLTRLLTVTEQPFLCSGIYTAVVAVFALMGNELNLMVLLPILVGVFLAASLYFWLLDHFSDSLPIYILVLIGGLAIGLG